MSLSLGGLRSLTLQAWVSGPLTTFCLTPRAALSLQYRTCPPGTVATSQPYPSRSSGLALLEN